MTSGRTMVVDIGELPVRLNTTDDALIALLERRYAGFLDSTTPPVFEFDVSVVPPGTFEGDADLFVRAHEGRWMLDRGDFRAEWDPRSRRGSIRQTLNPYAADSVLRIVHTLVLSTEGGFLLHAASAIRNGRAFVFAGPSGAGKTTMARLAPADVTLLTDEISYVRKTPAGYVAYGTPFAGELGESGDRVSAPLAAIYRLEQAPDTHVEPLTAGDGVRTLMRNVLFFAEDAGLTRQVFEAACDCACEVPMHRLSFTPDARAWEAVQ